MQPWQTEVMYHYNTVGEAWNPAQYYARAMERIRFYPAVLNEKGVPEESDDPKLLALWRRIQSPSGAPGDMTELAGTYGRLQFLIGDGLLTVSEDSGQEAWEYLSPMELRLQPGANPGEPQSYYRIRAPGLLPEELAEAPDSAFGPITGADARVWRLWRRHPEYSQWSDSPMRPLRELYDLLSRLTLAAAAEASSRAAQRGLLYVPEELSFTADPQVDEDPGEDPLIQRLTDSMNRAIQNPGTAEAMAPFVMRGPGTIQTPGGMTPMADLIRWLPLGPGDRYAEGDLWDKVVTRLAGGLDFPKEILTGVGDVNHWTAWFLDDIGFRQHTGPVVIRFCNDLGGAYLRPAAQDAGVANADRVVVGFDASQAINHPDETGTARDAYDRYALSAEYYRQKIGAPESAAPTDAELTKRVSLDVRRRAIVPPDVADTPVGQKPPQGETPPSQGGRGGDVNQNPPNGSQPRPAPTAPPSPNPGMSAMILGAALQQVERAREIAGSRLKRRAQSCDDCRPIIAATPLSSLPATFGVDRVRELIDGSTTEQRLVEGSADSFARLLRSWDIDGGWPEQLAKMVEQHALRTLYEAKAPPLPPGFLAACQKATTA